MKVRIVQVAAGWTAVGKDWAVVGAIREDAVAKYQEAERHHGSGIERIGAADRANASP